MAVFHTTILVCEGRHVDYELCGAVFSEGLPTGEETRERAATFGWTHHNEKSIDLDLCPACSVRLKAKPRRC